MEFTFALHASKEITGIQNCLEKEKTKWYKSIEPAKTGELVRRAERKAEPSTLEPDADNAAVGRCQNRLMQGASPSGAPCFCVEQNADSPQFVNTVIQTKTHSTAAG